MKVKLITYTPNPEHLAAIAGRRCYSGDSNDGLVLGVSDMGAVKAREYVERITGCGHATIIEHASFTFAVEGVSRSLLAQITRHRIASFSVQSQRYVKGGNFDYVIPPRIVALGTEMMEKYMQQMAQVQAWYDGWAEALGGGRDAYEDARFVLPNAAETKFVVTMNARELLHFFTLRCCNRAQWEIRGLAYQMLQLVRPLAPAFFAKAGPACLRGPCPEGRLSCGKQKEVREKYEGGADD